MKSSKKNLTPTVVDLFGGAGGLSLGFHRAGWNIVAAYDHDAASVRTHNHNVGCHAEECEITEMIPLPDATVIVGGPPCQGFSSAGARRNGDHRNTLVRVFANLVARSRPVAFVFENVEGFLTAESGDRVLDLLEPVLAAGYRVHLRKINAANYGVPQHRKRVLAIGGLNWDPSFPEPTHRAFGAPGSSLVGQALPQTPTLREALHGLPLAAPEPPGEPLDHFTRPLSSADLARVKHLEPGQTMRDLPEHLWHDTYRRRAYRRVMDGTPTERRGGAPAGLRRLSADEPSKAITSGARSEFIHPQEDRFLTLRECARIQTFPDDFVFHGTQAERALQIGNAVPPRLAEVVASSLLRDLERAAPHLSGGALLSFLPTVSNGMSPALRSTTEAVVQRFGQPESTTKQVSLWP